MQPEAQQPATYPPVPFVPTPNTPAEEELQVSLAIQQSFADHVRFQQRVAQPLSSGRGRGAACSATATVKPRAADALSLKYWKEGELDYDDHVCDGFYEVFGDFLEVVDSSTEFPQLATLRKVRTLDEDPREVIVVDHEHDSDLLGVEESLAEAMGDAQAQGTAARVKVLADVVVQQLGGIFDCVEAMDHFWLAASVNERKRTRSAVLLLGRLGAGTTRHRALLFKVLADAAKIKCKLVRKAALCGSDACAVNVVLVEGRELLVDLCVEPGRLYTPAEYMASVCQRTKQLGSWGGAGNGAATPLSAAHPARVRVADPQPGAQSSTATGHRSPTIAPLPPPVQQQPRSGQAQQPAPAAHAGAGQPNTSAALQHQPVTTGMPALALPPPPATSTSPHAAAAPGPLTQRSPFAVGSQAPSGAVVTSGHGPAIAGNRVRFTITEPKPGPQSSAAPNKPLPVLPMPQNDSAAPPTSAVRANGKLHSACGAGASSPSLADASQQFATAHMPSKARSAGDLQAAQQPAAAAPAHPPVNPRTVDLIYLEPDLIRLDSLPEPQPATTPTDAGTLHKRQDSVDPSTGWVRFSNSSNALAVGSNGGGAKSAASSGGGNAASVHGPSPLGQPIGSGLTSVSSSVPSVPSPDATGAGTGSTSRSSASAVSAFAAPLPSPFAAHQSAGVADLLSSSAPGTSPKLQATLALGSEPLPHGGRAQPAAVAAPQQQQPSPPDSEPAVPGQPLPSFRLQGMVVPPASAAPAHVGSAPAHSASALSQAYARVAAGPTGGLPRTPLVAGPDPGSAAAAQAAHAGSALYTPNATGAPVGSSLAATAATPQSDPRKPASSTSTTPFASNLSSPFSTPATAAPAEPLGDQFADLSPFNADPGPPSSAGTTEGRARAKSVAGGPQAASNSGPGSATKGGSLERDRAIAAAAAVAGLGAGAHSSHRGVSMDEGRDAAEERKGGFFADLSPFNMSKATSAASSTGGSNATGSMGGAGGGSHRRTGSHAQSLAGGPTVNNVQPIVELPSSDNSAEATPRVSYSSGADHGGVPMQQQRGGRPMHRHTGSATDALSADFASMRVTPHLGGSTGGTTVRPGPLLPATPHVPMMSSTPQAALLVHAFAAVQNGQQAQNYFFQQFGMWPAVLLQMAGAADFGGAPPSAPMQQQQLWAPHWGHQQQQQPITTLALPTPQQGPSLAPWTRHADSLTPWQQGAGQAAPLELGYGQSAGGAITTSQPQGPGPSGQGPASPFAQPPPQPAQQSRSMPRTSNTGSMVGHDGPEPPLLQATFSSTLPASHRDFEIQPSELTFGQRVGIGSYGEVYKGTWRGTDVAIKRFLEQNLSPSTIKEFRDEVLIMSRLRHPNIVLFMGVVTQPSQLAIVTQFVARGSLFRLLHRQKVDLDPRRRLSIAMDIAKGMEYLHNCKPMLVHRDLKSPNLLVDRDWTIKVCDFGLSQVKGATFLTTRSNGGTPEWMAPEVLRNEPCNEKSDVYSYGVILFEMVTGQEPWSGLNPMQVVGVVGFGGQRLELPADLDPAVVHLIQACWADKPHERPSFTQILAALHQLGELRPTAAVMEQIAANKQRAAAAAAAGSGAA